MNDIFWLWIFLLAISCLGTIFKTGKARMFMLTQGVFLSLLLGLSFFSHRFTEFDFIFWSILLVSLLVLKLIVGLMLHHSKER